MIRKIILGATLSFFAVSASAASLTLINNESTAIQVNCNNITGIPIPAKQGTDAGKLSLPYFLIAAKFEGNNLNCTFTDGKGNTGNANLVISPTYLTAQIKSYDPKTGVDVEPMASITAPVSDITVTLNQL